MTCPLPAASRENCAAWSQKREDRAPGTGCWHMTNYGRCINGQALLDQMRKGKQKTY